MPELQLKLIKHSCPNALFDAKVFKDVPLFRTIQALASQLLNLAYCSESGQCRITNSKALVSSFNNCEVLRHLDLRYCSLELAKAICTRPKPKIENLAKGAVRAMSKREETQMLKLFQKNTGELKFFGFRGVQAEMRCGLTIGRAVCTVVWYEMGLGLLRLICRVQ